MTFPSFTPRTDLVDIVYSSDVNSAYTEIEIMAKGIGVPRYATIQDLTTDLVLFDTSMVVQSFTLDANRNIYLPATSTDNHPFYLWNRTASSDGFTATVLTSTSDSVDTVSSGSLKLVQPDGANGWISLGGAGGGVQSIVAGSNITVSSTDPANPIVSAVSGGTNLSSVWVAG